MSQDSRWAGRFSTFFLTVALLVALGGMIGLASGRFDNYSSVTRGWLAIGWAGGTYVAFVVSFVFTGRSWGERLATIFTFFVLVPLIGLFLIHLSGG